MLLKPSQYIDPALLSLSFFAQLLALIVHV